MIRLELPLPPSTNRIWRRAKQGHVYLDKSVKAFREAVFYLAKQQHRKPITEPVRMKVTVHPASNRVIDIDNRAKSLLDALEHARFIENDSQVTDLHLVKGAPLPPLGKCVVEVTVIR